MVRNNPPETFSSKELPEDVQLTKERLSDILVSRVRRSLSTPVVHEPIPLNLDELAFVATEHEHTAGHDLEEPQLDACLLNRRRPKPLHDGTNRRFLSRLRKSVPVFLPQEPNLRNSKALHRVELYAERNLDNRGAFKIWDV